MTIRRWRKCRPAKPPPLAFVPAAMDIKAPVGGRCHCLVWLRARGLGPFVSHDSAVAAVPTPCGQQAVRRGPDARCSKLDLQVLLPSIRTEYG